MIVRRPSNLRATLLTLVASASASTDYVSWRQVSATSELGSGDPGFEATGPSARGAMAATHQPLAETAALGDDLWIFGGIETAPSSYSSELWSYSVRTAAWTKVTPVGGGGPAALEGSAMCSVGHTLYLFGGTDAGFTPSDKLWTYDTQLGFWAEMAQVSRPAARSYHTLTRVGDALFLFGGSDDESSPLDDLHTLDLISLVWTAVGAAGAPPTPRKGHTASLANDRLYVFGGMGAGGGLLGDAYELDTRSLEWRALQTYGDQPPGQYGHSANVVGQKLYVFGGEDAQAKVNDVRVLDLHSLRWSRPLSVGESPAARWGHAATLINQQLYVFGGIGASQAALGDMWVMAPSCSAAGGVVTLTNARGTFSTGAGTYPDNAVCSWLLQPSKANSEVRLFFSRFDVEQDADFVRVHDGADADAPAVAALTGTELPATIVSTSGSLYVEFTSDNAVAKEGFEATWFVLCAPGYVADPALAGDCVPCAKGSFAAAAGQDACVPCAAGEYAASTGASACSPCPDYSRAIAGGAASVAECECLQGYAPAPLAGQGTGAGTGACELCPAGAECAGDGAALRALPGWCINSNTSFVACCTPAECPGGDSACPSEAETAPEGQPECVVPQILEMSVLAFVLAAVVLGLSLLLCGLVCFFIGWRKGEKHAVDNMVSPLEEAMAALEVDAVPAEMSLGPSPTGLRLNGLSKAMFSPRSDASSQQGGGTGGNVVVDLEASARGAESR